MSNKNLKKSHTKLLLIIFVIFVAIGVGVIYFGVIKNPELVKNNNSSMKVEVDGVVLNPLKEITDFNLVDNHGKLFTKANLQGRWTMMFFGFTNCGMVCPTTMAALNKMYIQLKKELPENKLPQIVMVSVDPERDNISKMNSYVTAFNPNFIGLSGKTIEILGLTKQLHIVAIKIQAEGQDKNNYSMDHSAEILLFNPEGKVQAYLSYPHKPEQMVKDYKTIIAIS